MGGGFPTPANVAFQAAGLAGAAPLPAWVHPGIAEPPDDGAVDGVVVGEVDDELPEDDPPVDEPPAVPLDPDGAVVELLLVAAVAVPPVNSVAPTAAPARSEPTTPATATAFRVRFMHVSFRWVRSPRYGARFSIRAEPQPPVGRGWEVAGSFGPFLRAGACMK